MDLFTEPGKGPQVCATGSWEARLLLKVGIVAVGSHFGIGLPIWNIIRPFTLSLWDQHQGSLEGLVVRLALNKACLPYESDLFTGPVIAGVWGGCE